MDIVTETSGFNPYMVEFPIHFVYFYTENSLVQ